MPFAPHIILYLFIFPKILQERRTTLQHVIVRRIKIAGVPRIRNVPMTARKLKQLVHLAVRVALQHAMEIFHIPFVHADNIVCLLIILPGDLRSAVRQHRNADLSQLADSTVVWRVADLLRACGTGVDVELIGEVLFVDKVLENELHHGGTADVAVADEKYFNHNLYNPPKAFKALYFLAFSVSSIFSCFTRFFTNLHKFPFKMCSKVCSKSSPSPPLFIRLSLSSHH